MNKQDNTTSAEQARVTIPLPTEAEAQRDVQADIDFSYRDMTDEQRILQATKDMELIYASDEPPQMPKKMPRFVKAYLSIIPEYYHQAYSQAGFPAAAVLMDNVSFRHPNNLFFPAKINCLVVGPSGVGKNGLPLIFNTLLADLMDESHRNMEREVEVKEQNSLLGNNSNKKARPEGLVQRIVFTNTTIPALAQQMKQNKGLPCFMTAKEIEELYNFKNGAGGMSPQVLLREADDPDGKLRQRRVGEKSVTVDVDLFLNYCVSATPDAALGFFGKDLLKGALNRQEVAFIPDQPLGDEEEAYKLNIKQYVKRLQPFIDNLKKAPEHADEDGHIVCKQAIELHKKLKKECAAYVQTTGDRTWDTLTHRGLTHAFLKACVLYIANGCKWEPAIEAFIRWSLHYCLWSKLYIFGDKLREAEGRVKYSKPGKPNLLKLFTGNIFTLKDAMTIRKNQGMDDSFKATKNILGVWKKRGWIKQNSDGSYEKLEYKK